MRTPLVTLAVLWVACLRVVPSAATESMGHSLRNSVGPDFLVRFQDKGMAATVNKALGEAERQLGEASCRRVLTDFEDAAGDPLQNRLEAHGVSAQDYLHLVVFMDGSGQKQCRNRSIVAFTMVGSRAVFVCGTAFRTLSRTRPDLAGVLLIHEMLHSLGLEENPPTSHDITRRVSERCGDGATVAGRR